ncbi:MAG: hypothetical protein JW829_00205 [Pirellulales bacterium]|nr:hypothetical protein [Pirellulales bacterium]
MEPTKRQAEVLKAIVSFWQKHGYAPTIREITDGIGNSSPQGAAVLLKCLEAKGYITRNGIRPRTIRVLRLPSDNENGGPTDVPPEPGVYENVPFEDYLAWDAVSNSRTSLALR